jgi:hypothetical protein
MRRDNPAGSDHSMGDSLKHSILELLAWTRGGARVALAVGLLAGCGSALGASTTTNAIPGGLTVRRSMRAAPHRLIVHPSGATLVANQTQRFGVTDAQGNPVAVRWNVSGIGCSGSSCGMIDEQGIYHPPSSLPQPGIVTVEGVLVSDPNYSVLTEVRLEAADTVAANPTAQAPVRKMQEIAAPAVERQPIASRAALPPLPNAIAAAPGIGKQNASSVRNVLPLPNAVAAAPVVEAGKVARDRELPPVPNAIAVAPAVERQTVARNGELPPLPRVVAATPAIDKQSVSNRGALPPLPRAVGAAPEIGKQKVVHSIELPLPTVVTVAPQVERRDVARKVELPPVPKAVGAVPEVGGSTLTNADNSRPLPQLVASLSPASSQIYSEKTQLPAGIVKQKPAGGAALPPMQDVVAAAPAGSASTQHASAVTYSDGQLTINAENLTLAAVLQLVAEKTGAVIDVPPGTGLERIFEHAGPGRAEDVLASLLNGSPFDFVIVGSPQRQHAPTQVLLSLHSADDKNASLPPPPKTLGSPAPWTPPPPADTASVYIPPDLDGRDLEPPKEPLAPEVLDRLMKERTKQLRERMQQQ